MWEFRDQQLHKLQHQRHFQRAISANSKPWVLREQLLDAVRGAGVADVINAAMNSAWTPWLPMAGDHATTGTITQAVHAPPGENVSLACSHTHTHPTLQSVNGLQQRPAPAAGKQQHYDSRLVIWVARLCWA